MTEIDRAMWHRVNWMLTHRAEAERIYEQRRRERALETWAMRVWASLKAWW